MELFKTKTFWAGMAAVLTAVGAYLSGEANAAQALEGSFLGIIAIFLRHGIAKLPSQAAK